MRSSWRRTCVKMLKCNANIWTCTFQRPRRLVLCSAAFFLIYLVGIFGKGRPSLSAAPQDNLALVSNMESLLSSSGPHSMVAAPLDTMSIVQQAGLPAGSGHPSGDFVRNASAASTAACWRQLAVAHGRRPLLAVVGDSRGRYLYHHLRHRWRLSAERHNGSDCLRRFWHRHRTDWCYYGSRSPELELKFFWSRLADGALLEVLDAVRVSCVTEPTSCPLLLIITLGTHVLYSPGASNSDKLLTEGIGIKQAAAALQRLSQLGVGVFWKLSEPENYERILEVSEPVNYAHLIYNALIVDHLEQVAPSVRRWSSVLPPAMNYIARCRLDRVWERRPDNSPLWNCYDHLHYGDVVQKQYGNLLQQYLCQQA